MESKIISIYDYHKVDLSEYKKEFVLDEGEIQKQIASIQNNNSKWEEGEEICHGDIAECMLESEIAKFKKAKTKIAVGSNLLHKDLEQALVGKKKGETVTVTVDGSAVAVTVLAVMHRVTMPLDDEMIKKLEIQGVETVSGFIEYQKQKQKENLLEEIEYPAVEYVMGQVLNQSDIVMKKKDWLNVVQLELDKHRVLAKLQGLELENMSSEDFEGKIPVNSYHELVAMVQESNWDTVAAYVIGKSYAEKDGYIPNQKEYENYICEYADFWHNTEDEAKSITSYQYFVLSQYTGYFYRKIRNYVRENILV